MQRFSHADVAAMTAEDALDAFGSSARGLTEDEAARRLSADGRNELPHAKPPSLPLRFARQFANPLIAILGAIAIAMPFLDATEDAIAILFVLLLNATIGLVQEGRADAALNALDAASGPTAVALRGGHPRRLAASELVIGDVVHLEAGDRVPADGRVLSAQDLRIDEAALTIGRLCEVASP